MVIDTLTNEIRSCDLEWHCQSIVGPTWDRPWIKLGDVAQG